MSHLCGLGRLLRLIDLEISHMELEKFLPNSYLKKNQKAIQ